MSRSNPSVRILNGKAKKRSFTFRLEPVDAELFESLIDQIHAAWEEFYAQHPKATHEQQYARENVQKRFIRDAIRAVVQAGLRQGVTTGRIGDVVILGHQEESFDEWFYQREWIKRRKKSAFNPPELPLRYFVGLKN